MKKLLGVLLLSCAVSHTSFGAPTSAEQLRAEFESALKAKDTNAILSLVNWNGVAAEMKSDLTQEMGEAAGSTVASVKLLPLSSDYQPTNELNGVRYYPNVHVQGMIEVTFQAKKVENTQIPSEEIPFGESNGAFYIAGTVQETFDARAEKSIPLGVSVMGLFSKDEPGILTCSYVYVSAGKEKSESFLCTNNWSTGFWGDYFKSCKVTKVSGSGKFKLTISENAKKVFDSKMTATNDTVFYDKKD